MSVLLKKQYLIMLCCIVSLVACTSKKETDTPTPVLVGLDGREFFEPKRSPKQEATLMKNLREARQNFDHDPSEDNYIWYGRREAYLSHFDKAIAIFTEGIEKYPQSYRLYRHRAHRYITIRKFDKAIEDSEKAVTLLENVPIESEPDGAPNALNIPVSNTQFNVWYHFGLAHYLKGEYENAAMAYESCLKFADNDDLLLAVSDWYYLTEIRLGNKEQAATLLEKVTQNMNLLENHSYHIRLLMYKGLQNPDLLLAIKEGDTNPDLALATQGYGVGSWYLMQGDTTKAVDVFKQVVKGEYFSAFGFIASEAELQRLN